MMLTNIKLVSKNNFVFQLHYRWTVLLLLFCSLIVTCRLVLGHSFSCMDVGGVPQHHLETKCYSDGVYSLPIQLIRNHDPDVVTPTEHPNVHGFRRYQHHYPWVNLLFIVQAIIFLLPHLAWRSYDSGCLLTKLTRGLDGANDDKRGTELCYLAKYVLTTQGKHKFYTAMYITCEVFNYAIALAQTLWIVHFFVVTGVPEFLPFDLKTWGDFQKFYFPSSGMCSLTVNKIHHQTICLLPLNRLYMILFLLLHAWYICLTILSGMVLVYRIVLLSPAQRVGAMRISAPWADKTTLKSLCHRLSFSDWFFLTRLQRVMTDIDFAQMLDKIAMVSACKTCDVRSDEDEKSCSFIDERKDMDSLADESPV